MEPDGDSVVEQVVVLEMTGRRAAVVLRLADALEEALAARELTDLYERFERPLVRVLAIRHHVVERSTARRLEALAALGLGSAQDLAALADAQAVFLDLILAQQIENIASGVPPTNKVAVKRLSRRDRDRLRAALEQVRNLDELARDLLFRN